MRKHMFGTSAVVAVTLGMLAACGGQDALIADVAAGPPAPTAEQAYAPRDVPELGVLPGPGYVPPAAPAESARDCDSVAAAAPKPPLRLTTAPDRLNPEPLCIVDTTEPLQVNLLYLPSGANATDSIQTLMRNGAVSVITAYDDGRGRVPLPGASSSEPVHNAQFGYVRARLARDVDSRVYRVNKDWVNTLWYARLDGIPVAVLLSAGGVSPSDAAQLAADAISGSTRHAPPRAEDVPTGASQQWRGAS